MLQTLRPRQDAAIHQLRQSFLAGKKRVMLKAPTGFGKTTVAAHICDSALKRGKRVIFAVDAISLVEQTAERFIQQGLSNIGIVQADHPMANPSAPLQVCSVQTLSRRRYLPEADLVLIDEAHRWYEFHGKWMEKWDNIRFIGLSATPYTKGLGRWYDDMIGTATLQELIDEGALSDFRVFAPHKPDLSGVKLVAGDYNEQQLAEVMNRAHLVAGIVDNWMEKAKGLPTLVYAVDRAHAKAIQTSFDMAGINAGYIDAYTKIEERKQIEGWFHDGRMPVVVNVGCLTTGIDWDVRCIVMARPTKSDILYVQIVGRGLRTAEGKDKLLILDHSSTTLRLGFVTDVDERHPALDTGEKKKSSDSKSEEERVTECIMCGALRQPKKHACPECGYKPERQPTVQHAQGELAELTRTQKKNNRDFTAEQKSAFYGELLYHARSHGKKDGWAAHVYRQRFGVWPNKIKPALQPPSAETQSYIRSMNIRRAKRRAAA